jgi:DNA-binding response OmpR family regulator
MKGEIVVIEDDKDILEAIEFLLSTENYKVRGYSNAEEAEKTLRSSKINPDLIIMDILLSGRDGRIIANDLKTNKSTKNIPIILLSAHPNVEKTLSANLADDFIAKPFEIDDLLNRVKKYLTAN